MALLAGGVFEILKTVGTLYIARGQQGREATFGAFATAATLLVASYLLSQITLLAAELNAVLAERPVRWSHESGKVSATSDAVLRGYAV